MNETGYRIRGGNWWDCQSRGSTLSNPCSRSHFAVFRTLLSRRYAPKRRLEWFDRGRSIQTSCLLPPV